MSNGGNGQPSIDRAEHIGLNDTGDNIEAKRVALYQWNGTGWERYTGGLVGDGGIFGDGNTRTPVRVTEDGELMVAQTPQERSVVARYGDADISATKYVVLVDLSDTTNFPHNSTGRIDISEMALQVDRDATATGRVILGVITRIDGTDADISYVTGVMFEKNDVTSIRVIDNLAPAQIKLGVINGETPSFISNSKEVDVTAVNTGVALDSPRGTATVTPAVGDVILKLYRTAGSYNVSARIVYHSEAAA